MDLTRRIVVGVLIALLAPAAIAQQKFITVASTTSTEQSGLFKHLLPLFTQKAGTEVRVVAVGTGQALDIGRRGVRMSCSCRPRSRRNSSPGAWGAPVPVMYNDFVPSVPSQIGANPGGKDALGLFANQGCAGAVRLARRPQRHSC
jgi:tungstate transport system substrate-binding protein